MEKDLTMQLLKELEAGKLTAQEAFDRLRNEPYEDLGYAKVDHHRTLQQGFGEVIFGQNKTKEQILGIAQALLNAGNKNILVTRIKPEAAEYLLKQIKGCEYDEIAKICIVNPQREEKLIGNIAIVSAGTSDMPVCEEAALTAQAMGSKVTRLYDAGVSGIHRLLSNVDKLEKARVVVAVAGMEGALASVVGGLVSVPVIAVPTSVGYGANFGGLSALLSMLNSCASGVSVVNIDNGFGAGYLAHMINTMEGIK